VTPAPAGGHLRSAAADAVRAAAIGMVVVLHVAAWVVVSFGRVPANEWWVGNLVDAAMRPAVPLFVMVSGLLLLEPGRSEAGLQFLAGRARRVLLPFLGWVAIYFGWRSVYHGERLTFSAVVREALEGPVYPHLWFLYMIFGLYLAVPILRVFVHHARDDELRYLLAAWVATTSVPALLHALTGVRWGLDIVVTVGYVGYFVLGHVLRRASVAIGRRHAAVLAVALGITAVGTGWLSQRAGRLDPALYDYFAPNVIAMAALLFVILRSLDWARLFESRPWLGIIITWLARANFGIYLVHPIFQELFQGGLLGFRLHGLTTHPAFGIPAASLAILLASALTIAGLQRCGPIGRLLVP
jgi:surface polysaccharide O-acyltransferase-like enzyme